MSADNSVWYYSDLRAERRELDAQSTSFVFVVAFRKTLYNEVLTVTLLTCSGDFA